MQTGRGSEDLKGGGVCCNLGEQVRGGATFTFITGARFASTHMTSETEDSGEAPEQLRWNKIRIQGEM